ncbi:glycosyltransferase family 9 protein [Agromyces albus]|uniref:glycosyltransferase family 9 protein n=1 Tax=Agromyces albus TaxID=205332 RepID=UPI00277F0C63|nr:glycosyltransferase family 9 protein [Agromyces albus]MDQ0575566.1 ADP-heptose:LPS heptosyltransferase [Agromyces albus]
MSRRVLIVRLDSVGDVLLAGPAVRAVAARAEVDLLCGPTGAPAGRLLPGVRHVHEWDCPWIGNPARPASVEAVDELNAIVATVRPDEAVILTSFHQSPLPLALLLRLAGIERLSGASVDYAGSLLDVRLRPGEDFPESQSEVTRALTIAAAAGYELPPGDDGRLAVRPTPDPAPLVGREPYVVVHPGAAVPARAWPVTHHVAAVRALADAGLRVVVTGSAGERGETARVAGDIAVDLGGRTDLAVLAGVLGSADAVVVGNTGAAHLAAAVSTPVVSLFSPVVDETCWRPFGVPTVLLGRTDTACAGTRARECPVPGHPCLADIEPKHVVEAVFAIRRQRSAEFGAVATEAVPA